MRDEMLRSIRREQIEQSTKGANQNFCFECGAVINAKAELCPKCGGKNRVAATKAVTNRSPRPLRSVHPPPPTPHPPPTDRRASFFSARSMKTFGAR
jgi:ribosomal protein L40E